MGKKQKFILIILTIIIISFPIWYFLFGLEEKPPANGYNKNENAIWLEHEWVDSKKSAVEIKNLIDNFGDKRIKYVFMHVGPIESDGIISVEKFKYARDFLNTARMYGDKIKYLAWMGQMRTKIDLANPVVRFQIAETARILTEETGFDGIHYDIEPIYDNDLDFIFLLETTKSKIGQNKILSVAINEVLPNLPRKILRLFKPNIAPLSEDIYKKIEQKTDQIAVMTYENNIKEPWLYRYFLKNEVIWLTRAINSRKILVGIPSYEKGINAEAENIENGLLGIIDGLKNTRSKKESFLGVAIYINKETSDKEWKIYKELWIK